MNALTIRRRVAPAALLSLAALLGAAPQASAVPVSGPTTVTFTGAAFAKQGVKVQASGRTTPVAESRPVRMVLPTTQSVFRSNGATVKHVGSTIVLRRKSAGKTRRVRVQNLELRLAKKPVVSAKIAGKRVDLLRLDLRANEYTATKQGAVVRVENTRGTLTPKAAKVIAKGLGLRSVKRSAFAVVTTTSSAPTSSSTGGGPTGSGGGGSAPSAGGKSYVEPTPLARPAGAVDVTSSSLTWKVRESLVCYLWTGNGIAAADGATAAPPRPMTYCGGNTFSTDFSFVPAGGWYDPASGTARLTFSGTVQMRYESHGLGIDLKNPELEINGDQSRVIFRFDGVKASAVRTRAVFIDLNPATADRSGTAGNAFSFKNTDGGLAEGAAYDAFSGFYDVGSSQGTFDVAFTTP